MARLLIMIPAYNEQGAIEAVLKSLPVRVLGIKTDVLVVDDGSTDETAMIAQKFRAYVMRHIINRGLGAALATGFAYARKKGYQFVLTFDADGQHQASDIPRLVRPL